MFLDKSHVRKMIIFFADNLKKLVFQQNLDVFFSRFSNTHVGNTLLVDDTPYKFIFNDLCSAIFLEPWEGLCSDGDYLLSIVLLYLVSLHSSIFNV